MDRPEILDNLANFTEWGGRPWQFLCRTALDRIGDLNGKTVLEIGPRFGRMSACFALLGAQVVGVDTDAAALQLARLETDKWGVSSRVTFVHYDGDFDHSSLSVLPQFDVVFSKSVLVKLGSSLPSRLRQLHGRLRDDGRCVFIENRRGHRLFSLVRRVWPSSRRHYASVSYFDDSHISLIDDIFRVKEVIHTSIPPVCLIVADKTPSDVRRPS